MSPHKPFVQAKVLHEDGRGNPTAVLIGDRYWYAAVDQEACRLREELLSLRAQVGAAAGAELVEALLDAERADRNRILHLFIKEIGRWLMESGHRAIWERLYLVLYEDGEAGEYLRDATDLHDYREHDEIRAILHIGDWRSYLAMIQEQEQRADEQRAGTEEGSNSNG